jgi:two-component system KDP operon response regulator KdpE
VGVNCPISKYNNNPKEYRMNEEIHILVVDDEPKLVLLVRQILSALGYQVSAASSGEQAVENVAMEQPDLVILDIMLLGELDGYDTVRRIREFSDISIVMLTARVRESDMLRGFEVGVDDYVKKPFSSKELVARVRAVLKRAQAGTQSQEETEILCGEIRIDLPRHRVTIAGQDVHLTPTEYKLLHELARNSNRAMLHEQLLSAVWGPEYRTDFDYLRSYIHLLRRKLEPDPANPKYIIRVPGVGYMLEVD